MKIPPHVANTIEPPLLILHDWIEKAGGNVLYLGQAQVNIPPPKEFNDAITEALTNKAINGYSADEGLLTSRQLLAELFQKDYGVTFDPSSEIIITPGANQACFAGMMSLLEPGDEILVPTPWYFNHAMIATLINAKPVPVVLEPSSGFHLDVNQFQKQLTPKTRGVILVSPGNPTATVFRPDEVKEMVAFCQQNNLWILSDETYRYLTFTKDTLSPCQIAKEQTLLVGSFSKALGIAGWRLGYLAAPKHVVKAALKVIDSSNICPTHIAQYGLNGALKVFDRHTAVLKETIQSRMHAFINGFKKAGGTPPKISDGACFLFMKIGDNVDDVEFCQRLIAEKRIAVVPGQYFGESGRGYVRVGVGCVDEKQLEFAGEEMARFIQTCRN
jgi:aminotransferase